VSLGIGPHPGGCACGKVRYVLQHTGGMQPYACHCRDCQTRSGSAVMLNLHIALDQLELAGEVIRADIEKADGSTTTQFACPGCLTRIYSSGSARPSAGILRAGTLDASNELQPAVHLWTSSKQTWLTIADGVPAFETQPENPTEWLKHLRPQATA
jgi:hypothetical protein